MVFKLDKKMDQQNKIITHVHICLYLLCVGTTYTAYKFLSFLATCKLVL